MYWYLVCSSETVTRLLLSLFSFTLIHFKMFQNVSTFFWLAHQYVLSSLVRRPSFLTVSVIYTASLL